MKTYTDQVYNCAAFKYNPNAHPFVTVCDVKENAAPYTLRGYLNLFDQNAMLRDISLYQKNPFRGKTEANCNVYACMLSYNFSLHGVFSTVCIITSGNPAAALQTNRHQRSRCGCGTGFSVSLPCHRKSAAAGQRDRPFYTTHIMMPAAGRRVEKLWQIWHFEATLRRLWCRLEKRTPTAAKSSGRALPP